MIPTIEEISARLTEVLDSYIGEYSDAKMLVRLTADMEGILRELIVNMFGGPARSAQSIKFITTQNGNNVTAGNLYTVLLMNPEWWLNVLPWDEIKEDQTEIVLRGGLTIRYLPILLPFREEPRIEIVQPGGEKEL